MNIRFELNNKSVENIKVLNASNGHVATINFKRGEKPIVVATGQLGLESDWVGDIHKFMTQYDREIQGFTTRMGKICSEFGTPKLKRTVVTTS